MRKLFVVLGLLLLATRVHAQTHYAGFPMYGSFEIGDADAVNRQDLNSNFSIPIYSGTGRGINLNLNVAYNSLLWQNVNGKWSSVTDQNGNATWGWNTTAVPGIITGQENTVSCDWFQNGKEFYGTTKVYSNYGYIEPNGTLHSFASLDRQVSTCPNQSFGGATSGYAGDNSGYFMNTLTSTIWSPSGTVITASKMEDTNGNFISSTTNSNETDWTDSAGHLALKIISGSPTISYEYQDTTGVYRTIALTLQTFNVKTNFACSGIIEFTGSASLPVSVSYPNGLTYALTYEATPGNSGYVTGRVSKVTLPNGGYIDYQYGATNDGINCSDASVTSLTRTIYDGANSNEWQFTRAPSGTNWLTTVTAPKMAYDTVANESTFLFNVGAEEITKKIYQGSTSGTLLRTINTTWSTSNSTPAAQITILEDNSTQSEIETSYDSYGNLLSLKEHDYGTGAPGSILRTTTYSPLSTSVYVNAHILNRIGQKSIADSTGIIQYVEDIGYDAGTLSPCPTGVAQHDDASYGCSSMTRGNPTSVTTYTNASAKTGAEIKNKYYDVFGNVVKADVDCCQSKQWSFSATTKYAYPDSVTSGASGGPQTTSSFTYDAYTGLLATSKDANNQVTSYGYDDMKRQLLLTRPDQAKFTWAYNDTAHTVTKSDPIQGTSVEETTNDLDGLGRSEKTVLANGLGTTYSILQRVFDPVSRLYQTANPYTSTAQYWTTQQYDALGRSTKRILQDNSTETYSYSLNLTTKTDPAGHQRKFQMDGMGRTSVVYEPDPTNNNSLTLQTGYTFSVLGPPLTVTQGVQTRTSVYDGMGRLTSETTPEAGTVGYQYNSWDKISQRTDARGVITTYNYDTLNRPYTVTYNVGSSGVPATGSVTYTYGTSATQFNNGRLLTITDGSGSETFSYDLLGRTTQDQQVISGSTYTIGYQYNLASRITSITYPSQRVIQQNYDTVGRPSSIVDGSTTYASGITFDPNFRMTGFSYGNGVTTTVGFSANRLQFQSVSYAKSGQTLYGLSSYSYAQTGGNNGEITSITDSVDSGRSITYSYDSLDRVSTAITVGSTSYPQWGLSWTYDRYGNRTAQTVTAGTAFSNSVVVNTATNQITTAGYSYDANGNMTDDGQNALIYDAENRIVSDADGSGTATYTYRAEGLRAQKILNGTTTNYVYLGDQLLAEYANGVLTEEYVYLGKALIASYDSGTLYYHHNDHLSVRMTTDVNGNKVGEQGHYTFGEDWYLTNTTVKRHFTSYHRDSESSNDYAIHRYHVNRLGRFSSADPAEGCALKPQLFNRYSYVGNDPVDRVDPKGLFLEGGCDPWDGCVAGCGDFGDCPSPCGWGCGCETPTFGCPVYPTCPADHPPGSCPGLGGSPLPPAPPPPAPPASYVCDCVLAFPSVCGLGCPYLCVCSNKSVTTIYGRPHIGSRQLCTPTTVWNCDGTGRCTLLFPSSICGSPEILNPVVFR